MYCFAKWLSVICLVSWLAADELLAGMPAAYPVADPPADATTAAPAPEKVDPPNNAQLLAAPPGSSIIVGRFPGSYCRSLDCPHCGYPSFYFRADALVLRRDNSSINQPVVLSDRTGDTLLDTQSPGFNNRWGQSYVFGYRPDPCTAWEMSYFSVQGWNSSATATDANVLDLPLPLSAATSDFLNADAMRLTYRSQLHNIEWNRFRNATERLSLMAGFRYLNLNERFDINSIDSSTGTSDYNIHANNNLIGGQLGGRLHQQWGRFGVALTGKVGLFGNAVQEHQLIRDLNNSVVVRNSRSDGGKLSFVGDLGLVSTFRLTEHLAVRSGYNLIFIDQVALAPDQLDFSLNSTTRLNASGSVFYYGANFGLEARW